MSASEDAVRTQWQGVLVSALVPAIVVTGLVHHALGPQDLPESQIWAVGLACLIPLEFIRTLVVSLLGSAYETGRDPVQVIRTFLISVAILLAFCTVYVVLEGGISDGLSFLASPGLYKFVGLPLLITIVDGIFGVLSFSGDPRLQGERLQAFAEDSIDWLSLVLLRVPFLILPTYGLLVWAASAGWRFMAWVPTPSAAFGLRFAFLYAAAYFVGKTVLAAYVQTARFAQQRKRLLDVAWMKKVRNLFGKPGPKQPDTEKEAAQRYKDGPHAASVLRFEQDVIESLKRGSSSTTPNE